MRKNKMPSKVNEYEKVDDDDSLFSVTTNHVRVHGLKTEMLKKKAISVKLGCTLKTINL